MALIKYLFRHFFSALRLVLVLVVIGICLISLMSLTLEIYGILFNRKNIYVQCSKENFEVIYDSQIKVAPAEQETQRVVVLRDKNSLEVLIVLNFIGEDIFYIKPQNGYPFLKEIVGFQNAKIYKSETPFLWAISKITLLIFAVGFFLWIFALWGWKLFKVTMYKIK
ncbi:MAG: hypothetical protein V4507_05910 [Verrucomicrobiota bacterium]